jgi:hydrogenase maturation protease
MTRSTLRSLIVGIGSGHGDDQAGWKLIDTLSARRNASAQLRKASVPHDMIDWLTECESLHIVDACDSPHALRRLDVSDGCIPAQTKTRSSSSHQISVSGVVELAKSLELLPQRVTLWTIPGVEFHPNGEIGDRCMAQVELCANLIQEDLDHA